MRTSYDKTWRLAYTPAEVRVTELTRPPGAAELPGHGAILATSRRSDLCDLKLEPEARESAPCVPP